MVSQRSKKQWRLSVDNLWREVKGSLQNSDRELKREETSRMGEMVGRREGANEERVSPHPTHRGCYPFSSSNVNQLI